MELGSVDTIFTLCGGHIIDIYDGCVDEGIRIIDVRHEQVAAHAAERTGELVTIGIKPTHPETGFGYLEVDSIADGPPHASSGTAKLR